MPHKFEVHKVRPCAWNLSASNVEQQNLYWLFLSVGCKIYYAAILFLVIVLYVTFYICSVTGHKRNWLTLW